MWCGVRAGVGHVLRYAAPSPALISRAGGGLCWSEVWRWGMWAGVRPVQGAVYCRVVHNAMSVTAVLSVCPVRPGPP